MIKNYYYFVLLFIYIFGFGVDCQSSNTYQFFNTPKTVADAISSCGLLNSYLLVVNNKIEYDNVKLLAGNSNFWVSGVQLTLGQWTYLAGTNPEESISLYNTYTEECTLFCDWGSDAPLLNINQAYIYYNNLTNSWDTSDVSKTLPYICETGPNKASQSIVNQLPPGSSTPFKIGGLPQFFIGTVTFTNLATSINYTCNPSFQFLTEDTDCTGMVGSQPGIYNVTIAASIYFGGAKYFRMYQFNSPVLSSISTNGFTSGSVMTISGSNIGTDIGKVLTYFSSSQVPCTPGTFINLQTTLNEVAYTCTLAADIQTTLYPITISINNVISEFNRLPIYYNEKYISCSNIKLNKADVITFSNVRKLYALSAKLDIIESLIYFNFITKVCNYQVWQGAVYNLTSLSSFSNYQNNLQVSLYYENADLSGLTQNLITSFDTSNALLLENTVGSYGGLFYFKNPSPIEFKSNKTNTMYTNGGPIVFSLTNAGNLYDQVSVTIGGNLFSGPVIRDLTLNQVSITLDPMPPNKLFEVQITIGSKTTTPFTQFITVGIPTIVNIQQGLTSGGRITIDGQNFYDNISLIAFQFSTFSCTNLRFEIIHVKLSCIIPPGYGLGYSGTLTFNNTLQNTYLNYRYANPTISKISKIGGNGGLVTFTGQNFYNTTNLLRLTIITIGICNSPQLTIPHKEFTCTIVPGNLQSGNGYSVSLEIGTFTYPLSKKFNYERPIILSSTQNLEYNQTGEVGILGDYFSNVGLTASIGGVTCLNIVYIDPKNINCTYPGTVPPISNNTVAIPVTVNCSKVLVTYDVFFYKETPLPCPGSPVCSGNGECINSQCKCKEPYGTIDCSSIVKNDPPVISDNGDSTFLGNGFNFTTTVSYLRELDSINGSTVKLFKFQNLNWTTNNETLDPIYDNEYLLYHRTIQGILENETFIVDLEFKVYKKEDIINFAGDLLVIPKNSVKYNIKVSNWTFASDLNQLQIIFQSQSPIEYQKPISKCNSDTTQSNSSIVEPENGYGYQIKLDNSVFEAKFAKRYYLNNRITQTNIKILPSDDPLVISEQSSSKSSLIILTSISIPSFNESCTIDPSFISLIKTTDGSGQSDECDSNISDDKKWKTIVIIVVPSVVGVALIVGIAILISKKRVEFKSLARLKKLRS